MKKLFLFFLLLISFTSFSQTLTGDRIIGKSGIYLRDWWIDSIQRDTAFMNRLRSVPTSEAVRQFVEGRINSIVFQGGGNVPFVDSLYRSNDTIYWRKSGQVYNLGKYLTETAASLIYASRQALNDTALNIRALIKPTRWDSAIVAQSFDTTTRVLTYVRLNGSTGSFVIPRGAPGGANGIAVLSNSVTADSITIFGDNGAQTTFSRHDPAKLNVSDTTNKWQPKGNYAPQVHTHSIDDVNELQFTLNSKASLGALIDSANAIDARKQDKLASGVNIKTINGNDITGPGNLTIAGGGSTPANFANSYFDDAKTGSFNAVAQVSEDGNTLYGLLDNNTGELTTWTKTTKWIDGSDMIDSKVDGIIFRKKGVAYYKRNYEGPIQAKWFAKGDGITDVTALLNKALELAAGSELNFSDGKYVVSTQAAGSTHILRVPSNITINLGQATIQLAPNSEPGYEIFYINGQKNVTINDGTIIGDRNNHTGTTGEWGMGIAIMGSADVWLTNTTVKNCWGDNYYVGGSAINKNLYFDNTLSDSARRNGFTVGWVKGMYISNSTSRNTYGAPPEAGYDFEPNGGGTSSEIYVINSRSHNNTGAGFGMSGDRITITGSAAYDNGGYGFFYSGLGVTFDQNSFFSISNSRAERNGIIGLRLTGSAGKATINNMWVVGNGGSLTFTSTVSGTPTLPINGSVYVYNGNTFNVKSVTVNGDALTVAMQIDSAKGFMLPPPTGGVMKKLSGTGSDITYTSYTTAPNLAGIMIDKFPAPVSISNTHVINNIGRGIMQGSVTDEKLLLNNITVSGNTQGSLFNNNNGSWTGGAVDENLNTANTEGAITVYGNHWKFSGVGVYRNAATGIYVWGSNNTITGSEIYGNSQSSDGAYNNVTIASAASNVSVQSNGIWKHGGDIVVTVSSKIKYTIKPGARYYNGNSYFFVRTSNISQVDSLGTITLIPADGSVTPLPFSGVITLKFGDGYYSDTTISYSAFSNNQPAYGVQIRSGSYGTKNKVLNNVPDGAMGKSGDIRDDGTGNTTSWGGGGGVPGHTALTGLTADDHPQYFNINGRNGGQTIIPGIGNNDNLTIGTNPNGSGKIYFGSKDKRTYYDESTKTWVYDSSIVARYRYFSIGKIGNAPTAFRAEHIGTTITGSTGGFDLGHFFEDYTGKRLGGFGAYGSGTSFSYWYIGKNKDTAYVRVSDAATEIANKLRLLNVADSNNSAFKFLVQNTVSGDVYRRDIPDYSIGTQPETFGADADSTTRDDAALQAAINAAGKNGIIQLKRGVTYLLKSDIVLLQGQTIFGYGAKLKRANQVVTTTSTPITTGTSPTTITVADASGLEVGMKITVTGGPNGIDGCYAAHAITAINGNQVTVSSAFTKAFPTGGIVVTHHGLINATAGGVKIYGLEVDGNRQNNGSYTAWQTNYSIYVSGSQPVVADCNIHDNQADGIMAGGIGTLIDNNKVERSGGNGIHLSGLTAGKITRNYVNYATMAITGTNNNSGPSHAEGTMTWSNLISHTLVQGNYFGNARAMLGVIDGTDNNDNTITDNTGENFSLYTIEFKDGGGVNDNSLKNFIFSQNRIYNGVKLYFNNNGSNNYVYDAANRSFIVANNILDHTGIEITRGKDFSVYNNTIDFKGDSTSIVINLYGSSNYSVTNNTVLHGGTGIYVDGGNLAGNKEYAGTNGSINHNKLREQYVAGINVYSDFSHQHRNLTLSENTIIQTRTYLTNYIGIIGANGVKVESNKLDMQSGKYGINTLGDAVASNYGTVGTVVRFNWIKTSAATPSIRISPGTGKNVVEMNAIYQAISNGQPANNFVQSNVYDTLAVGYSSTAGGATAFDALTDVNIFGKANGSIPKWNSTTLKWEMGVDNVGSSAPVWGTITGTLSSQTDLQNALNAKENAFTKNTGFNKNFGTTAGTVAAGDDSRISNGQTAFGWGNHAGLYPLLTGSYANPAWISAIAWDKITGAPSFATVATTGNYNDLTNKPAIPTDNSQIGNSAGYISNVGFSVNGGAFNNRKNLNINCAGCSITSDLQTSSISLPTPQLSISGDQLSIANGNTITLPSSDKPAYVVISTAASYTIPAGWYFLTLGDLAGPGGNRLIAMPDATSNSGKPILIVNKNQSAFTYSFNESDVRDIQGNQISTVTNNASMMFVSNGTFWQKIY